jgi:3-phosphoshikimate 1-carboxyvinyltransferase
MQDSIFINRGCVSGKIEAYPSKSYIQRALLLGLLDKNGIEIRNYKCSGDSDAVFKAVIQLGAKIEIDGDKLKITGTDQFSSCNINCGESGLCLRMLTPVLALSEKEYIISGSESLLGRGNEYISEVFAQAGVKCCLKKDYLTVQGPLKSGEIYLENPSGSQLVTGLVFALSKADGDSVITIKDPVSSPYIKMTAGLLNGFGAEIYYENENKIRIRGNRDFIHGVIEIEGDWSSAAFFLVAGAVSGEVTVSELNINSLQPDALIVNYLKAAGASVEIHNDKINIRKSNLNGFDADIKDHPDLFIPLVILAMNCEGISRIYNFKRLKYKESDRPAAIISELSKAGAKITEETDHIRIEKSELCFAELNTYNDHRLAMGFAVAALNSLSGLMIKDIQSVNKSFPGFFKELGSIIKEKIE